MTAKQNKPNPKGSSIPTWAKYMGLSFQLFATISGGTALGWWIQQQSTLKFPFWILLCSLAAVPIAFYSLWKSMQQDK